jgi:hypothetical protein
MSAVDFGPWANRSRRKFGDPANILSSFSSSFLPMRLSVLASSFLELRNGQNRFVSLVPFSDLTFVDEFLRRFCDLFVASAV